MRRTPFHHVFIFVLLVLPSSLKAEEFLVHPSLEPMRGNSPQKLSLVVEFGDPSPAGSKLDDAIQQAKKEFAPLESVAVPDERELSHYLETKPEGSVGLVVLIHPRDMESLAKLPGLYPDMLFTVIDAEQTMYANNIQSVRFREEDGVFLLGAIASIRSSDKLAIMAMEENDRERRMADNFTAGAKHINPNAQLISMLNIRPSAEQRTRLASTVTSAFQQGTAILFSMDDDIIEQGLRAAKPERKMVVSGNAPPPGADTSRLLTYLVKRYDLALLDVLRIYSHNQWHNGTIELGVSGGYVDYSLNADNVDVFPKEAIDQIEAIKDHLGQAW